MAIKRLEVMSRRCRRAVVKAHDRIVMPPITVVRKSRVRSDRVKLKLSKVRMAILPTTVEPKPTVRNGRVKLKPSKARRSTRHANLAVHRVSVTPKLRNKAHSVAKQEVEAIVNMEPLVLLVQRQLAERRRLLLFRSLDGKA